MMRPKLALLGAVIAILGIVAYLSLFIVHQTKQALVLQFGNPLRVERDPGLKVKMPWQNVQFLDNRILDLDPPVQEVLLADQLRVNVDAFARYRIVDPLMFYQRAVTIDNFRLIFGGRLNSQVRSEVAKVALADMLSDQRAVVMGRIAEGVRRQAPDFGVEVVDVRVGRTDLPEATSQAVYNRMRSERIAQAAQLRAEGEQLKATIQAEADRDRTIILAEATKRAQIMRGEGDAQRTVILNEAYGRDVDFFDFYRSLEAYSAIGGAGSSMVLSPDADFFRFFLDEQGKTPKAGR